MSRTAVLVSIVLHVAILGGLWAVGGASPVEAPVEQPEVVESARMQIRWVPRESLPDVEKPPAEVTEESVAVDARPPALTPAPFQPRAVRGLSGAEAPAAAPPSRAPEMAASSESPESTATVRPSSTAPRVALPPTDATLPATNPTASPTLVSRVVVEYPERCRRLGHEGVVELRLDIEPSGEVSGAVVTKSSGCSRLDAAARKAALTLEYLPAHVDGAPRAGRANLEIRFSLEDARQ